MMIRLLIAIAAGSTFAQQCDAQSHVLRTSPVVKQVVHIKTTTDSGLYGWGSGVWIDSTHVMTALHVISEGRKIEVLWMGERILAEVESLEPIADWALLRTEPTEKIPAATLRTEPVAEGESLVGYGYGGIENGYRYLRAIEGKACKVGVAGSQHPRSGDSGGPVFDSQGRLVCVINSRIEGEPVWFGHGLRMSLRDFIVGKRGFRR